MDIRCVKGMYRLKIVSSENNLVFKGLTYVLACGHISLNACLNISQTLNILVQRQRLGYCQSAALATVAATAQV